MRRTVWHACLEQGPPSWPRISPIPTIGDTAGEHSRQRPLVKRTTPFLPPFFQHVNAALTGRELPQFVALRPSKRTHAKSLPAKPVCDGSRWAFVSGVEQRHSTTALEITSKPFAIGGAAIEFQYADFAR